jgi:16S rRNA C967 or C1407 C5-methylase (RsmB/RsmF family)
VPLARAAGDGGRVFAVDIDEAALKRLRSRLEKEAVKNVTVVRGGEEDPGLTTGSLDAVLVLNTLH